MSLAPLTLLSVAPQKPVRGLPMMITFRAPTGLWPFPRYPVKTISEGLEPTVEVSEYIADWGWTLEILDRFNGPIEMVSGNFNTDLHHELILTPILRDIFVKLTTGDGVTTVALATCGRSIPAGGSISPDAQPGEPCLPVIPVVEMVDPTKIYVRIDGDGHRHFTPPPP